MDLTETDKLNIRISNLESRIALLEIKVLEREKKREHESWSVMGGTV